MKIDTDVLAILSDSTISGEFLMLPGYLKRPMYLRANMVIEAAGGKWNRKAKAHLFNGPAADILDQIFLTGEISIPKDFGYFPTPRAVVALMIEKAELHKRHRVLEPSAGQGAIAFEAAKLCATVDCVELLDENWRVLSKHLALRSLITHGDFLAMTPTLLYDRILMNPPFGKQADIHHVMHALRFLKPLGLLVAIMSASVTFRENNLSREFRQLVGLRGGTIDELPEGSFLQSGTGVRTVIVTLPGQ